MRIKRIILTIVVSLLLPGIVWGAFVVSQGGTNITSYTAGDLLYASGQYVLDKLGIGGEGQFLTITGGVPAWGDAVDLTTEQNIAGAKTFISNVLTSAGDCTSDTEYCQKSYIDAVVTGQSARSSVRAVTTDALPASTYGNGTAGVGAYIWGDANGALAAQDGVTLVFEDRLLVKDQGDPVENGIYVVIDPGDVDNAFYLERAEDFDEDDSSEIANGAFAPVLEGTLYSNSLWMLTSAAPFTVGTTPLEFVQLSASPVYVAGDGLDLDNLTFSTDIAADDGLEIVSTELTVDYDDSSIGIVSDALAVKALGITNDMLAGSISLTDKVTGVLPEANGGTGESTYTSGQILIGNSANGLTKNTITAGTDIEITSGSGSIVISSTGSGGAVYTGDGVSSTTPLIMIGNSSLLTAERAIAVGATNLTYADGGANSSYTIDTIQDIHTGATPTFSNLNITYNATTSYLTVGSAPAYSIFSAGNANIQNNITLGGYATTTGGLFTQGNAHVGGALTIDTPLAVAQGGTASTTIATGQIMYGSSQDVIGALAPPSGANQVMRSSGAAAFAWGALVDADIPNTITASNYLLNSLYYATTTWAGGGDLIVNGNTTTTNKLVVGSTNPTTDAPFWVGGNSYFNGGATTTGTIFTSSYASSTIGFNTQGTLHVGGTSSFDGEISSTYINNSGTATTTELCFSDGSCQSSVNVLGSAVIFYFHEEDDPIGGYEQLLTDAPDLNEEVDNCAASNGYCAIDEYISTSTALNTTSWPAGTWIFHMFASVDTPAPATGYIKIEVYKRATGGTETQLFSATSTVITSSAPLEYEIRSVQSEFTVLASDRLLIKILGYNSGVPTRTISYYYEGMTHTSHVVTPFTSNIDLGLYTQSNVDETITSEWTFSGNASTTGNLYVTTLRTPEITDFFDNNCGAGEYVNAISIAGNFTCTDATTEINSAITTHTNAAQAHSDYLLNTTDTLTGTLTLTDNLIVGDGDYISTPSATAYNIYFGDKSTTGQYGNLWVKGSLNGEYGLNVYPRDEAGTPVTWAHFGYSSNANKVFIGTASDEDSVTIDTSGNMVVAGTVTGSSFVGNASTASALAANGANCSAGSYPLGVNAAGAAESCTDATTEINSAITTHTNGAQAHSDYLLNTTDTMNGVLTSVGSSPNPSSGVDTFALVGSGNYGGGLGFIDGTGNYGIWTSGSGTLLHFGQGSSLGALTAKMQLNSSGDLQIDRDLTVSGGDVLLGSGDDNGIKFWNGSSNYTITMGDDQANHGTVTDYSMHFNMGATANRGFTWGSADATVSASLNALTGDFVTDGQVAIDGAAINGSYSLSLQTGLTGYPSVNTGYGIASGWIVLSDSRMKTEQKEINYGLEEILHLKPKRYTQRSYEFVDGKIILGDGSESIGLIAQEVLGIIPESVHPAEDEENGIWALNYDSFIPVIIKAIQELNEKINTKFTATDDKIDAINNKLNEIDSVEDTVIIMQSGIVSTEPFVKEILVLFDEPFDEEPIVTVSHIGNSEDPHFVSFFITEKTQHGFTIIINKYRERTYDFEWIAIPR